jgi:hypothetical protein
MINKVRPMINESSPTILGPAPNYSEELSKSNEGVAKYCAERPKDRRDLFKKLLQQTPGISSNVRAQNDRRAAPVPTPFAHHPCLAKTQDRNAA